MKKIILLFLLSLFAGALQATKIVYFLPSNWGENIFDPKSQAWHRHSGYNLEPLLKLHKKAAEAGYDLRVANPNTLEPTDSKGQAIEEFEYFIVFDIWPHQLAYLKNYPKEKLILILWEPPSISLINYDPAQHEIFSKVLTWRDDLVDGKKYFKFCWPVLHPMADDYAPFSLKKFAVLFGTNRSSPHPDELYSQRFSTVNFYENNHPADLDLFGRWWPTSLKVFLGLAENKLEMLKKYKFNYAYENQKNIPGYIDEKIFDPFRSGCVPVYCGASNITDYIPKNCYILREAFESDQKLYEFLQSMKEEEYNQYLENIRNFLMSEQAQLFSFDHFVDMMMDIITHS